MARKQCVACGEFKNETEFPWWSETEGRRRGTCRACKSQQQKKWYSKKRETHIANVKSNIEQARTEAVSYTHLDVYKRQGEDVLGAGRLHFGVALDNDQQVAAALNSRLHRRQRRAAADGHGRRDAGENRAPAQGDNGDGSCFVKVAHLGVLCRRLVRNNPQI